MLICVRQNPKPGLSQERSLHGSILLAVASAEQKGLDPSWSNTVPPAGRTRRVWTSMSPLRVGHGEQPGSSVL